MLKQLLKTTNLLMDRKPFGISSSKKYLILKLAEHLQLDSFLETPESSKHLNVNNGFNNAKRFCSYLETSIL